MMIAVALLLLASVTMFFEIFVPGGILGLLGILFAAGAIAAGYFYGGPGLGTAFLAVTVIVLVSDIFIAIYVLPKTAFGKRLMLSGHLEKSQSSEDSSALLGKQGTAMSDLRPSGVAEIEGARRDVVADCEFIQKGSAVEVIAVEGFRIEVKKIEKAKNNPN